MRSLRVAMLPLLSIIACEHLAASRFIAAFAAGLVVQIGFKDAGKHSIEFTEGWGQLLSFFIFYLFGLLVVQNWTQFNLPLLLYAVLSLTIVRILPVAIALTGSGLSASTVLFIGWFGPRGLASIVLGVVYHEQQAALPGEPTIRLAVMPTVLLSIFVHGFSANPGIALYHGRIGELRKTGRIA